MELLLFFNLATTAYLIARPTIMVVDILTFLFAQTIFVHFGNVGELAEFHAEVAVLIYLGYALQRIRSYHHCLGLCPWLWFDLIKT